MRRPRRSWLHDVGSSFQQDGDTVIGITADSAPVGVPSGYGI
jgi:hypothetical protein